MNHGRLPWLTPDELDDDQRRVYDLIVAGPRNRGTRASALVDELGRFQGPFNAMLFDPTVGEAVQNLGSVLRYSTNLDTKTREIAILVAAGAAKSSFEWHAHSHLARAAGMTDDDIDAIVDDREPTTLTSQDRLVWRVARMLVKEHDLDDATFAEAESTLGRVMIMDLIVLIGYYELLARSLRVWRTPMPDGVTPKFGAY